MKNPLQKLAEAAMEMIVEGGSQDLVGSISLAVFPHSLFICCHKEDHKDFDGFVKEFSEKFPGAPVQFIQGKSQRITDMMVIGVVEELISGLNDEYELHWESSDLGELIVFKDKPSTSQMEHLRSSLEVFGSDGKYRRLFVIWDKADSSSMEIIELNAKRKGSNESPKKMLKGISELGDPDRARNIPITKDNLTDLKIVLASANSLEDILAAMDKVGVHGLD